MVDVNAALHSSVYIKTLETSEACCGGRERTQFVEALPGARPGAAARACGECARGVPRDGLVNKLVLVLLYIHGTQLIQYSLYSLARAEPARACGSSGPRPCPAHLATLAQLFRH